VATAAPFVNLGKEKDMILRVLFCFCVLGASLTGVAGAQPKGDTELYEQQLSQYSNFHKEYAEQQQKEYVERHTVVQKLRQELNDLLAEYEAIEGENEDAKKSIQELKQLNKKLRDNQAELQAQYESLDLLYQEQQKENERLKNEMKKSRSKFQQKVLDSYKEENAMLTEQLTALQLREKELESKIVELESALANEPLQQTGDEESADSIAE